MSRLGGFAGFWSAMDRLRLVGATPVDALSLQSLPLGRWLAVEVVAAVTFGAGQHSYTVRDSSGRTARLDVDPSRFVPKVGDRGCFRAQLAEGSPRPVRLASEPLFALVDSNGRVTRTSSVLHELLPDVRYVEEFVREARTRLAR